MQPKKSYMQLSAPSQNHKKVIESQIHFFFYYCFVTLAAISSRDLSYKLTRAWLTTARNLAPEMLLCYGSSSEGHVIVWLSRATPSLAGRRSDYGGENIIIIITAVSSQISSELFILHLVLIGRHVCICVSLFFSWILVQILRGKSRSYLYLFWGGNKKQNW